MRGGPEEPGDWHTGGGSSEGTRSWSKCHSRVVLTPPDPEGAPVRKGLSRTPRRGLRLGPALEQIRPGVPEHLVTHRTCTGLQQSLWGDAQMSLSDSADALKASPKQMDKDKSQAWFALFHSEEGAGHVVSTPSEQLCLSLSGPHSGEAGLCRGASL